MADITLASEILAMFRNTNTAMKYVKKTEKKNKRNY